MLSGLIGCYLGGVLVTAHFATTGSMDQPEWYNVVFVSMLWPVLMVRDMVFRD